MPIRIKQQSPWKSQVLVTKALLKREVITRVGKYKLGALWILLDPLLSVIVIGLFLGPFLGRSSGEIPYAFFLLCGFMQLQIFTGSLTAGIKAISSNQGLLVFKKVQPLDPFIARFFFQLLANSIALVIFCAVAYWIGIEVSLNYIPEAVVCIILTWVIGAGLGLYTGILCQRFNELEKVITYMQRPLLFLSCVIIPLDAIPPQYRSLLLYNPLVHTVESLRIAFFPDYHAGDVNFYYPAAWGLAACVLGLMTYRNNRHFLTQR